MREIINYAEMTCDFCGKVEHIKASQVLPKGWSTAEIPQSEWTFNKKYDLCPDCIKKLEDIIECLKNHPEVDVVKLIENDIKKNRCNDGVGDIVTSLHGKCICNNMEQDLDFCK